MNPDIESWLNFINKNKRKRNDTTSDEFFIKELYYIAYDSIENLINDYKLTGRKLTSFLTILEDTFDYSKDYFKNLINKDNKETNLLISAYSSIIVLIIKDLKLELYSNGKKFNIKKYFENKKKENYIPKSKKVKFESPNININLDLDLDNDDNNINNLNEDSEYSTTDDEYNNSDDNDIWDDDDDEEEDDDDEDYDDDEEDSEDEYEENEDEDEEEDNKDTRNHIINKETNKYSNNKNLNKNFIKEFNKSFINNTSKDEIIRYFCDLEENTKKDLLNQIKNINNYLDNNKPLLFKILSLPLHIETKKNLLNTLSTISTGYSENSKLKAWLDNILKIPFGVYKGINFSTIKKTKVPEFLDKLKSYMDDAVFGHNIPKASILQIISQSIRNPNSKGSIIGIWGPPGNGKTTLIKEGIAKAMNKPFVFISLGGATDSSFLEGHSFTYEGSIYGRIARGIIESKCMNPIIYFDELDKISSTRKGDEIINLLIHLIDSSQNSKFRDKYFHDLDIDLSKVTFIFSFNDPSKINYILADRITLIETKNITLVQKINIGKNYLLKNILKDIGLNTNSIIMSDTILSHIIETYTNEGGVRKFKELLYEICRIINMKNLIKESINNNIIEFPYTLTKNCINEIFEHKNKCTIDYIHQDNSIGIVNGLWANYLGQGGILPIESLLIPSNNLMSIKATGSLEKVIKESIDVALSVAWNNITDDIKDSWIKKWKNNPESFHIHCPDGAVSKDGPSAGAAITLVLYSRLMNKKILNNIAMTGEINLQGKVTKIGGLEEKLLGAKKAGVQLVLIPEENVDDLHKIKKRQNKLFNNNFQIKTINNFSEVLKYSLIN